jgi:FMN phosphatase YigB (HAD superfamily)
MVKIESVISDFDGVVTDGWREAQTYTEKFIQRLSAVLRMTPNDLSPLLDIAKNEIGFHPGMYGWEFQPPGAEKPIIVAPATADPYVYMFAQASWAMSRLREERGALHIPSVTETPTLLQQLYRECYPFAGTYFREGAREYLQKLRDYARLTILTNSETVQVQQKLSLLLGADYGITVVGNAKKYQVDSGWTVMTETMTIPGLPRPVYLRRKKYNDALDAIRRQTGSVDTVVGDIWELDLALPESQRIRTVLVTSRNTPTWEQANYDNHTNGFRSSSLSEVVQRLLFH